MVCSLARGVNSWFSANAAQVESSFRKRLATGASLGATSAECQMRGCPVVANASWYNRLMTRQQTTATTEQSAPGLAMLVDPRFVASLAILVLNDRVLKAAYGNWLTGKASDLVGLIVLPIVVTALLRAVRLQIDHRVVMTVTAVWFAAMKTLVPVAAATERLVEGLAGVNSTIVVDPTDLIGLVGLLVAAAIIENPRPAIDRRALRFALLSIGLIACLGSSNDDTVQTDLRMDPETGTVEASLRWVEDELPEPNPATGDGIFATDACLDNGECFRIRDGEVERQTADVWATEYAIRPSGLNLFDPIGTGCCHDASYRATDIMSGPDGDLYVAYDGIPPTRRLANGDWNPPFSHYRRILEVALALVTAMMLAASAIVTVKRATNTFAAIGCAILGVSVWIGNGSSVFSGLLLVMVIGAMVIASALLIGILAGGPRYERARIGGILTIAGAALAITPLLVWKYTLSAPASMMLLSPVLAVATLALVAWTVRHSGGPTPIQTTLAREA